MTYRKALVLVFSNIKHDARVSRQIDFLRKSFKVSVAAFDVDERPNISVIKIHQSPLMPLTKLRMAFLLALRLYNQAYHVFHSYQDLTGKLAMLEWDLIVANDIDTLPMAFSIKGKSKAKIIFDAHEYAPRHFENRLLWRIFFQPFYIHLCKKYFPHVDRMLTVGKGLAVEYHKSFAVEPSIITNATRYFDIQPTAPTPGKIKLVHHGIANPSRRLELMLEMMKYLDDRFTLNLILMTSDFASGSTRNYIENLKEQFLSDSRISILPAVHSNEVVPTINRYDIGLFLLPPVNFNYANAMPNKLFDFIQARLAVAIGPSPEMAEIVNQYDLGVVSPSFDPKDLAMVLSKIEHNQIIKHKHNAGIAAKELCAEKNDELMTSLVDKLFV